MKRFFICLFILLPFLSNAQSNFKPGYLITNTGDRIPGFINYKERDQNPRSFTFRSTINAPSKVYKISEAKAYGLDGLEQYERYAVDITRSKEALKDLSVGLDSTSIRDTVFLKVLQAGKKLTMYAYSDDIKLRYYIKEQNSSEPYELVYASYKVDETGKVKDYNKYIRQLTVLLIGNNLFTPAIQAKVQSLTYNKMPILDIVSIINDQKIEKGMKSARFFVGAAFNTSMASYMGQSMFNAPGFTNKRSYAPMITAGMDLFANPHIGRVMYRVELSLTSAKSDIYGPHTDPTVDYKEHFFDSYSVIFSPQGIWNFYNTNRNKAFVGVGVAVIYTKYMNNIMHTKLTHTGELRIEEENDFNYTYFAPQLSGGFVVNRRFEVFANYMFNGKTGDFFNYSLSMSRLNAGVKLLFGHML
ncbi:MAG: hypothetical protein JWQ28_284 [Pedobacter sp.]|jgi:hypothetical protein|nr:hypothetical protein [Pedobacter sp.]